MTSEERKEAIRKFKERKPAIGIFAIRCAATGSVWVGSSRNLEATRNGSWASLRMGAHREKSLQEQWNRHGEPAFAYDILHKLPDDTHPLALNDLLKQKRTEWLAQLNAHPLL